MNINKKLSQDGEQETASQIDLFKSKNTGDLTYKTQYGLPVAIADKNYVNTATAKTYKIYTALLTQRGIDTPESQTKGAVKAGVSYVISFPLRQKDSWDFSNVGGPIYPDDYSFVATSDDVPNDYGPAELVYNTGAPVVTVLENTIGNVWFTYNDVGVYSINSNELFTLNKVAGFITFNNGGNNGLGDKPNFAISPSESNTVYIDSVLDGVKSNDILFNTPIEIRVYN
jgi:hypothetical protein